MPEGIGYGAEAGASAGGAGVRRRQPGQNAQPQGNQAASPQEMMMPQTPPSVPRLFNPLPSPDPDLLAQAVGMDGGADQGGMFQLVMSLLGRR